jgi:hypothetical protein
VEVDDGGECFFNVHYDVESASFRTCGSTARREPVVMGGVAYGIFR